MHIDLEVALVGPINGAKSVELLLETRHCAIRAGRTEPWIDAVKTGERRR